MWNAATAAENSWNMSVATAVAAFRTQDYAARALAGGDMAQVVDNDWAHFQADLTATRENWWAIGRVFSAQEAVKLTPIVKALEDDFYKSEAHLTAANLSEMKDAAISDFSRLYPDFPSVIADAFAWCYTFDYK